MPNRLANETSPYLRQHRNNPVDWYPWGDEALERARRCDLPIFLSIGYAACHWCHVMERESFEDPAIARLLNEHFVSIKVDREERPDLDQIYMSAVQMMTGRGGWPMSVFLTPELKPFYGGTYWPPEGRFGLPGFRQVVSAVAKTWAERRGQAESMASELVGAMEEMEPPSDLTAFGQWAQEASLLGAAEAMARNADRQYGGFGGAPKFPQPQALRFLLRADRRRSDDEWRAVVRRTMDAMYRGGMYDHLGGGFARYSVDTRWLVPHFEKMLYDNAQLALAYVEGFQVFGEWWMERVARETLDYVLREMQHASGGFFSSQDADSEGVEGKFYVWTREEIEAALGEDADFMIAAFGVSEAGNWEGKNVLHLPRPMSQLADEQGVELSDWVERFDRLRSRLLAVRARRVAPATDDKLITAWNGLMIESLAAAGAALGERSYIEAATRCACFLWRDLRDCDGRLLRTWREGQAKIAAFLDDYACFALGLLRLYEATFDTEWLGRAELLIESMLALFYNEEERRFDYVGRDRPVVVTRRSPVTDSGTPGGVASASLALARLAAMGRPDLWPAAEAAVAAARPYVERAPLAVAAALVGLDWLVGPAVSDVLPHSASDRSVDSIVRVWHARFRPHSILAVGEPESLACDAPRSIRSLLSEKPVPHDISLYRCVGPTCEAPVVGAARILAFLEETA